MPIILKSGSLNLLESSGPVIGLYSVCFFNFTTSANVMSICTEMLKYSRPLSVIYHNNLVHADPTSGAEGRKE